MFLPRQPAGRLLMVMVLLLLVSACGVKFVYNKLDWLIPWYIDDYVSLNAQQEMLLDQRLVAYLARHRREQLPVYADFFEQVASAAEDGLDSAELDQLIARTETFGNELFASIASSFYEIFSQLSDDQIQEIRRNLQDKNLELEERYVEREARYQRQTRAEDMQKFLQRWLGDLRDEQVVMIEDWAQRYRLMGAEFMQSRLGWQQRFFEVLELRDDPQAFKPALIELFSTRYLQRSPAHQAKFEFNEALLKDLYQRLDGTLSSYQRYNLQAELRDYAGDFRELSSE